MAAGAVLRRRQARFGGLLDSFTLPVLTLCLAVIAQMTRMTRAALVGVLDSAYIEMARLKGLRPARIVLRHALPNAAGPIANAAALSLSSLLGGVIIVEVDLQLSRPRQADGGRGLHPRHAADPGLRHDLLRRLPAAGAAGRPLLRSCPTRGCARHERHGPARPAQRAAWTIAGGDRPGDRCASGCWSPWSAPLLAPHHAGAILRLGDAVADVAPAPRSAPTISGRDMLSRVIFGARYTRRRAPCWRAVLACAARHRAGHLRGGARRLDRCARSAASPDALISIPI